MPWIGWTTLWRTERISELVVVNRILTLIDLHRVRKWSEAVHRVLGERLLVKYDLFHHLFVGDIQGMLHCPQIILALNDFFVYMSAVGICVEAFTVKRQQDYLCSEL